MRIHRLEIQAFGPFAERQSIDFDALTEQGLFLLNGPTGAGKSSVLDAICYALYGVVPGDRQNAKRLRSDHAPATLVPEVVCEFSAGSRRLEVTRSPAWQRPAKRGSGTTSEQARTLLRERLGGEWVTRSTRNEEAGAELQALLGMSREQFTRVVMLPQGEFAAFLRSNATSRAELLQRLFATDRFATVEHLLVDHAAAAAARRQRAEDELDAVLTRAREEVQRHGITLDEHAGGTDDPDGDRRAVPQTPAWPDLGHLQHRLEDAAVQARERAGALKSLQVAAGEKRTCLESERRIRTGYRRLLAEAEANRNALLESTRLRGALEKHRRAQILEGALLARDQAADEVRFREGALQSAIAALAADRATAGEVPEVDGSVPDGQSMVFECAHRRVREKLAEARAALPQEQELADLLARIDQGQRRLNDHRSDAARCTAERELAAVEILEVSAELEAAEEAVREAGRLAAECTEAREQLSLIVQAEEAEQSLGRLEKLHQDHHGRFLEAKEEWLRKLQIRLSQAAAELADGLCAGEPCPVCGSGEHPAPASVETGALMTREEEEHARGRQDSAEQLLRQTAEARDAAAITAAGLRARSGDLDAGQLGKTLETLQTKFVEVERAARTAPGVAERKARLDTELTRLESRRTELLQSQAEESSLLTVLQEQAASLALRVEAARSGYRSVSEQVAALARVEDRLGAVCSLLTQLNNVRSSLVKADAALHIRLAESDFESSGTAREALLSEAQVQDAERLIREAENTAHRIELDLQREENMSAAALERADKPVPADTEILEAARSEEDAAAALGRAVLEVGLLEQSVVQLATYADRARVLTERLEPLRRAHELARAVADTARGNGENLYKMSLATYVLAARLEQVAEAATERLQHMSDGRYSLVHSDAKFGNRKSGLGLDVIDSWTGIRRETATLSGGESFMAALALALGLADVVQQESGGLDIETLFVDEGFGSLDEQSLEQVMDALENLRDGGRVVGLVSHVPELKQRIPAQLHVTKGRSGSTLRFVDQLQRV